MKMRKPSVAAGALAMLLIPLLQPSISSGQGTAFTYQGRLNDGGLAASGNYDIQFYLRDAFAGGNPVGTTNIWASTTVSNGLFTVTLDFGAGIFTGQARWLEIGVRTNGSSGAYATLSPRQALTPSPYAIMANSANNLLGTLPAGSISNVVIAVNAITANQITNGQVVKSLNGLKDAVVIANGANVTLATNGNVLTISASGGWNTNGNAGANPTNGAFLGTTDNLPLEFKVNNLRALRLEPKTNEAPNVIGGSPVNFVSSGVLGAFIGGGGTTNDSGFSFTNSVAGNYGVIAGGEGNQIQTNATESTIGGGQQNTIQAGADHGTIAGGYVNTVAGRFASIGGGYINAAPGGIATVAGGLFNVASGNGSFIGGGGWDGTAESGNTNAGNSGVIGGGFGNTIQATAHYSTVGGGEHNTIQTNAVNATVGGGAQNQIQQGDSNATIGGGDNNTIQPGAFESTISGGGVNQILGGAYDSTIGGGGGNTIQAYANGSTIGGGLFNVASGNGSFIGGGGFDGTSESGNTNAGNAAVIGGGFGNTIQATADYSAIGGGDGNTIQINASVSTIAGGLFNVASGKGAFIGGGGFDGRSESGNTGAGNAAVIGGGLGNTIQTGASESTIGGGYGNQVSGIGSFIGGGGTDGGLVAGNIINANTAVIGGGLGNTIQAGAAKSTIGGGYLNTVQSNVFYGVIGGGGFNTNSGSLGTIPGGDHNVASANAFAAGHRAKANHTGSFVWADSTDADFADTSNNQFLIRASGGFRLNTSASGGARIVGGGLAVAGDSSPYSDAGPGVFEGNNGSVGYLYAYNYTNGSSGVPMPLCLNSPGGNVGIGTVSPVAPLHVSGSASRTTTDHFFNFGGSGNESSAVNNVSIKADFYVEAAGVLAVSDQRIKTIRARSDSATDLKTLMGIKITDYTFKDIVERGAGPQKKVIAQEVEQVYPQAVHRSVGVVPDVYQAAVVKDSWVQLATDLKVGERVRLIAGKEDVVREVLETREGAFRASLPISVDEVFIYGREVNDLRSVDYEAIAMLNVSATQELNRKAEAENTELRRILAEQRLSLQKREIEVTDLKDRLAWMETRFESLQKTVAHLNEKSGKILTANKPAEERE